MSLFLSVASDAATIRILSSTLAGTINSADADDDLNTFYQDAGFSSSIFSGAVTSTELSGVDLFIAMLPDDAFSSSEITVMSNFLATSGRILLIGEQHGFAATENGFLNSALASLGSAMSLGSSSIDSGFNNTSAGQISSHPLNSGVGLINYGNVNSVSGIPLGGELFLAKDLTTTWGGIESVGGGSVILLADSNMISNIEDTAGNDNHQFFLNVVPEPQSTVLIGLAATCFMLGRRRSIGKAKTNPTAC